MSPSVPASQASVIYDGDCAFCRRSVDILKRLDWFRRLSFVNFRAADQTLLKLPVLNNAPLVEEMHLLTPDGTRLYHGFGAFRWMAWRLPPICWLAPFLYIPGVPTLGQKAYLWVARNRFRLVPCHDGVCTIQSKDTKKSGTASGPGPLARDHASLTTDKKA